MYNEAEQHRCGLQGFTDGDTCPACQQPRLDIPGLKIFIEGEIRDEQMMRDSINTEHPNYEGGEEQECYRFHDRNIVRLNRILALIEQIENEKEAGRIARENLRQEYLKRKEAESALKNERERLLNEIGELREPNTYKAIDEMRRKYTTPTHTLKRNRRER